MSRMPHLLGARRGWRVTRLALLALGQAGAAGATAIAIREIFAHLGAPTPGMPTAALATLVGAGAVYGLLRWSERVAAEALGYDYANAVRLCVFSHIAALPIDTLALYRSGSLSLRFVGDLSAVRGWVGRGLAQLVSAAIVLPAVAVVLILLDPRMALAPVIGLGLGLLLMAAVGVALPERQRRLRRQRARLAGHVAERLAHAPHLRLLGRLPQERTQLVERADRLRQAAVRRQRRTSLLRVIPDVAQATAAAAILWIALRHAVPTGEAAAALAALALLTQPLRDLGGVWDRYAAWANARERCERLLAIPRLRAQRGRFKAPADTPGHGLPVRFHQVTAGALQGFDETIPPGRKIGITGPNGAGKSTLLALVAGLMAPEQGRVGVAGTSPAHTSGRQRRELLSYAGPSAPLLSGSLRRALTLGLKRRPDDRFIEQVAKDLGLDDTLRRLGGLDGRIAENGRNLSAGERRRVLLARTLLADAPLWLLDEPDDALDYRGRHALKQALGDTPATVVLVSLDWATLKTLDEIWFVDEGRLVETGGPNELIRRSGPTARFFALGETG